jgi:hypothetical protein
VTSSICGGVWRFGLMKGKTDVTGWPPGVTNGRHVADPRLSFQYRRTGLV